VGLSAATIAGTAVGDLPLGPAFALAAGGGPTSSIRYFARFVRGGSVAEPIAEMNVSGNLGELMKHLVAVGNDPYPYSTFCTPTLVFEGVQFAGN
jgi:predicted Zn-dependent protease